MMTNYEKVVKKFLPEFRASAARMMVNEYGATQQRTAEILGTTQAAVSKYLSERRGRKMRIDQRTLRSFVENSLKFEELDSQRAMCGLCQSNIKFDCSVMVK